MHQAPPLWPSSLSAPSPGVNGHDLHLGQALGHLTTLGTMQLHAMEQLTDRIERLPEAIARHLPKPPPPPPQFSFRDRAQMWVAAMIVAASLLGKPQLKEALVEAVKLVGL